MQAASANENAAEAQLALARYKAPRVLSPEQAASVAESMKQWATLPKSGAQQSVAVFPAASTFEAARLADQLAAVLGPAGANWSINRFPVTYEVGPLALTGVGLLISHNARAEQIANALVQVLNANGIIAFIVPARRRGCEEMDDETKAKSETDPWCSSISIMVGDKSA